jgi:hypothetical protein
MAQGGKKRVHKKNMDPKDLQRIEKLTQKREQEKLYQKQSQTIDTLEVYFRGSKPKPGQKGSEFQRPLDRGSQLGVSNLSRPPVKAS